MFTRQKEIMKALSEKNGISLEVIDKIGSTNTYLKARAADGAQEGSVAVALSQTDGRGRMQRQFASPHGSGIYMSILLRPRELACTGVLITACAAVAVSEAIEEVTGIQTDIKWVNDLYLSEKKICGILAEGAIDPKTSTFDHVVLGIGINLTDTFKDTELEDIAGGLYHTLTDEELLSLHTSLTAAIINRFFFYYRQGLENVMNELLTKYRSHLFLIGKTVDVISYSNTEEATVIALNDDFTLSVKYSDGKTEALNSGEVRLKIK